jgi:hypothetical protein
VSEPSTCGQGLAASAALPAGLAGVAEAMAGMLERHMTALDLTDPHSTAEHAVYGELAAVHRRAAGHLRAAADRMDGQRDLPMGPHDMAAIAHPATVQAFQHLVDAKRSLLALLRDTADEDDEMLDMMRGAAHDDDRRQDSASF